MNVLVTGANGYLGRHVVSELLKLGCDVFAVDLLTDDLDDRAKILDIDIFSGDKNIYKTLGRPDAVIHLAWRNGFVHNADSHIIDLPNHYLFIKNLIEGGLKNLTIMGTMHEVGYWEGAITENTPTNPISQYGIAKNALRQLTFTLAKKYDISLKWLRGFYITGDDAKGSSIFSKIVKAANLGENSFPLNSGKNKYDFIHIDDLAYQIAVSSVQYEVTGIINCCSGVPVPLGDKIEEFIKKNKLNIKLEYGKFPDREYDSPAIWGDKTKINKILS